jgi:hypothetical protein
MGEAFNFFRVLKPASLGSAFSTHIQFANGSVQALRWQNAGPHLLQAKVATPVFIFTA